MKISMQLWKSSDDSRYVLRHYAKWLWFEETRDQFEQNDKTLSSLIQRFQHTTQNNVIVTLKRRRDVALMS